MQFPIGTESHLSKGRFHWSQYMSKLILDKAAANEAMVAEACQRPERA